MTFVTEDEGWIGVPWSEDLEAAIASEIEHAEFLRDMMTRLPCPVPVTRDQHIAATLKLMRDGNVEVSFRLHGDDIVEVYWHPSQLILDRALDIAMLDAVRGGSLQ